MMCVQQFPAIINSCVVLTIANVWCTNTHKERPIPGFIQFLLIRWTRHLILTCRYNVEDQQGVVALGPGQTKEQRNKGMDPKRAVICPRHPAYGPKAYIWSAYYRAFRRHIWMSYHDLAHEVPLLTGLSISSYHTVLPPWAMLITHQCRICLFCLLDVSSLRRTPENPRKVARSWVT